MTHTTSGPPVEESNTLFKTRQEIIPPYSGSAPLKWGFKIITAFNIGWQRIEEGCRAILKSVRGVGNN